MILSLLVLKAISSDINLVKVLCNVTLYQNWVFFKILLCLWSATFLFCLKLIIIIIFIFFTTFITSGFHCRSSDIISILYYVVPSVPIIMCTTAILMFHNFLNSFTRSLFLPVFLKISSDFCCQIPFYIIKSCVSSILVWDVQSS